MQTKTTLKKLRDIPTKLNAKKLSEHFLFETMSLGILSYSIIAFMVDGISDTMDIVYSCTTPVFLSFLSIIVYALAWKDKVKIKYIIIHLLFDAVFLIMMIYFLQR